MNSPWQNPLPKEEYITNRVVVYFYSDFWIPIPGFCLSEAIALYRKAMFRGQELLVFPLGLDLEANNILVSKSLLGQHKLVSEDL